MRLLTLTVQRSGITVFIIYPSVKEKIEYCFRGLGIIQEATERPVPVLPYELPTDFPSNFESGALVALEPIFGSWRQRLAVRQVLQSQLRFGVSRFKGCRSGFPGCLICSLGRLGQSRLGRRLCRCAFELGL